MSSIRNNLDGIVNINIEVATPASTGGSFSDILLVVAGPDSKGAAEMSGVITITQARDLLEYGYTSGSQAYIAATVAFSQSPSPSKLYLIARGCQPDGSQHIPIADVLDQALEAGGWYGIGLESTFSTKDAIESVIKWTETNNKLFCFTITDIAAMPSITSYFRSFGIYAGGVPDVDGQPEGNKYAGVAWMAKCFGYEPGSETWALKQLAAISPSKLDAATKKKLEDARIAYFTAYASKNITNAGGGKVLGNEWVDTIRFRDWLKNDMQERLFNLLVLNPKLPFTDGGITAVQGKMEESLKKGQDAGGIAQTEYDGDGNEVPGYSTSVPRAASLTDAQKASRQLTGCRFRARLAGAIQAVEIDGALSY